MENVSGIKEKHSRAAYKVREHARAKYARHLSPIKKDAYSILFSLALMENVSGYYVYILVSEMDGSFYYGQTSDLANRLIRHNAGLESYSKKKIPWKILWYTQLETTALAMKLERKLKNMKSRKRVIEYISKTGHLNKDCD